MIGPTSARPSTLGAGSAADELKEMRSFALTRVAAMVATRLDRRSFGWKSMNLPWLEQSLGLGEEIFGHSVENLRAHVLGWR